MGTPSTNLLVRRSTSKPSTSLTPQVRQAGTAAQHAAEAREGLGKLERERLEDAAELERSYSAFASEAGALRDKVAALERALATATADAAEARHRLMVCETRASEVAWLDEREMLLEEILALRESRDGLVPASEHAALAARGEELALELAAQHVRSERGQLKVAELARKLRSAEAQLTSAASQLASLAHTEAAATHTAAASAAAASNAPRLLLANAALKEHLVRLAGNRRHQRQLATCLRAWHHFMARHRSQRSVADSLASAPQPTGAGGGALGTPPMSARSRQLVLFGDGEGWPCDAPHRRPPARAPLGPRDFVSLF